MKRILNQTSRARTTARINRAALLGALLTPVAGAHAQQPLPALPSVAPANTPTVGAASSDVNVASVGAAEARALDPALLARADAVSLDVASSGLSAPGVAALRGYVRSGGVIFLHTDAARLFGYTTVAARVGTRQRGGQLFGRAKAALPYTAHPLLWNDGRTGPAGPADRSAGVNLAFYQLRPGDHLVVQHPAGVPLLRVTDLATPSPQTLFSAAIAPYGRGWAVFSPFLLDQRRGDGALLARNFLALARSSRAARIALAGGAGGPLTALSWVGVPARGIEAVLPDVGVDRVDPATVFALCDQALGFGPETAAGNVSGSVLIVPRSEAEGLRAVVAGEGASERVMAALCLMRARLALQRSELNAAASWVAAAARRVPDNSEVALWEGAVLSAQAAPISVSSRDRALVWQRCAQRWAAASRLPLLLGGTAPAPSREALDSWARGADLAARLSSVEPPLVSTLGRGAGAVYVRHYPNDPTLALALPFGVWMATSASRFGWRVEDEEVLIFPTEVLYQAYRAASGLTRGASINPLGRYGDIQGERLLMVSQPNATMSLLGPGGQIRLVPVSGEVPSVLARLHALLLVNALAEGGPRVPNWITLGLNGLASASIQNPNVNLIGTSPLLRRFVARGMIYGPEQFDALPSTGERVTLAEAQATSLVAFFYARAGQGALVELLQRIGAARGSTRRCRLRQA
jgi:hypothetical protein